MSSEQLNTTSLGTIDIWMHVRGATSIQPSLRYAGLSWIGRGRLVATGNSPSAHTIEITIDDTCARRLGMGLIMGENREHSQARLRLILPPLNSSSPSTLEPSLPTSNGTPGSESNSADMESLPPSPADDGSFGADVQTMQHLERQLHTIRKALLRISLTEGCFKSGERQTVNYLCKSMMLSLSSIQSNLRTLLYLRSEDNLNTP